MEAAFPESESQEGVQLFAASPSHSLGKLLELWPHEAVLLLNSVIWHGMAWPGLNLSPVHF